MTKLTKPQLVPRLRFPEFQDDGEWEESVVDKLLKSIPPRDHQVPNSEINTEGNYPVVDQGKEIISGYSDCHDRLFKEHPVIVFGDHTTVIKFIDFDFIVGADGTKLLQKKHKEDSLRYLFYALEQFKMGQEGYKRHFSILKKILLPLPPTKPEQQKIADCLGSLDELIAAHVVRLDALQDHKKGLLQQLFPAEGQTIPSLRFPEFQNAGEWEEQRLPEIADNLNNKRIPITASDRKEGDTPYYGASGIVDYVEGYIFDEDLLCVSEDGANLVARTYPIAFKIIGKTWVNNHAHVLRFKESATQILVEAYLNAISLEDYLTGMAQPKLNREKLDSIQIPLPTLPEQKRIADCLSSLDGLIAAQAEQIAALKEHKKGLMQQLFPNKDGIC